MKRLLKIMAVLIMPLMFSGCFQSDIDSVKNATYAFDKGITIGKAFDNFKYWKRLGQESIDPKWRSFETNSGRKIVEFTANYNDEYLTIMPVPFDDAKFTIQWSINDDDTFQVYYQSVNGHVIVGEMKGKWQEFKSNTNREIMTQIKVIYQNQK